jgi:ABC-type multidrug transport system ATPase subunit
MAREAAVSIYALGKRYGPTLALETNDLTIDEGTRLAILGPNGAGKTTLILGTVGICR